MKIAVLTRYPKVERSTWKREVVEGLIRNGYEVSLVFGESSYLRHLKAALKTHGCDSLKVRSQISSSVEPRLSHYFDQQIKVVKQADLNDTWTEQVLRQIEPDLLLLLGTGIIRKNILEVPKVGTVHCHQGFLPRYRGVNTIEWSIFHGDDVYISTHFVDPGIDTGDMIMNEKIVITADDNISSIRKKCQKRSVPLILNTLDAIRDGTAKSRHQNPEVGKQFFSMHPFFLSVVENILRNSKP